MAEFSEFEKRVIDAHLDSIGVRPANRAEHAPIHFVDAMVKAAPWKPHHKDEDPPF